MLKVKTGLRFGGLLLGAFFFVSLVGPAFAGSVYSWVTEDGTHAFTDDPKRIPAKYKDAAKRRTVGQLKNYPRLTESKVSYETPYEKRVQSRLETLRAPAPPAVSAGPPGAAAHPLAVQIGTTSSENDQVSIPLIGDEPLVTTHHRVRMRDSIATRHIRVTKQGDRIVSVIVDERNQGPIDERIDADVDAVLPARTR